MSRNTEQTTPPGTEFILDNGAPGTSRTGPWRSKSNARDYGSNYLFAGKSNNASYRWTATPPGNAYRVYAWWVDKKNQSQDVTYSIRYGSGQIDTVTRSHRAGGGQWQLLGSYYSEDGQDYVEVSSTSNKFVADAIRWVSVNDPVTTVSDHIHYVHFDHLGTPRQVTNANQSVVWSWISAPFGDSAPDQDPDGDLTDFVLNLRFPGQYFDAESGLHYNYFRTYDPETGRYIESDPIGLEGGLNSFAYAGSNPQRYTDPLGLWVQRCARGLGDMNNPPKKPSGNPLRHDYLSVSGQILSFQAGGNPLISRGKIDRENELPGNPKCTMICDSDEFDQYVFKAALEIGAPTYCLWAYPGTKVHRLGTRNCQTWVNDVLELAKQKYLENETCPQCFN